MQDFHLGTVAIVIPCFNEPATIATVIRDFRCVLPEASIIAFDNNSTDDTARVAQEAGAEVINVPLQGKGNVVRRMFADVEADVYVMDDGDATYDGSVSPASIGKLVEERLDMVVGSRVADEKTAYRLGHRFGNLMLTQYVATSFGRTFKDMLSSDQIFSRRYAKSFPAHASVFETETKLTVHALCMRMPVAELPTRYISRPEGSESKLNTYRDGFRILMTILKLVKNGKPFALFTVGLMICALLSILLSIPVFRTYMETGFVPGLPTALLSTALMLLGPILLFRGLVLDNLTRGRIEVKRLVYLVIPAPQKRERA